MRQINIVLDQYLKIVSDYSSAQTNRRIYMKTSIVSTRIFSTTALALLASASLFCAFASAHEKGDILVRVGLTSVAPDESSSNISVAGGDLGFGVSVDSNTQLGLNIAYFVTDRWNIEVLAATPFSHDINVNSNSLGLTKLGEVKHLPPTVTANYFFATPEANFQPYAGIGLNYTVFFDEEFTATNEELGFSDLDLDGSFGLSAQAGFDYKINEKWFVNGSVRYIDISTDADFTLNNAGLGANNANGTVRVDIDPMVYTLSIGYKL